jgi:hypothetical protein
VLLDLRDKREREEQGEAAHARPPDATQTAEE